MSLTVNQMKKTLMDNNVPLPTGCSKKDIEKLYNELGSRNGSTGEFSSDDETGDGDGCGDETQTASSKVNGMSDEQIYKELLALGQNIGPVQVTTREFYKRKLIKIWNVLGHNNQEEYGTNGFHDAAEANGTFDSTGASGSGSANGFSSEEDPDDVELETTQTSSEREPSPAKPKPKERKATPPFAGAGTSETRAGDYKDDFDPSVEWEAYLQREERKLHRRFPGTSTSTASYQQEEYKSRPDKAKKGKVDLDEGGTGNTGTIIIGMIVLVMLLVVGYYLYNFSQMIEAYGNHFVSYFQSLFGSSPSAEDEIEEAIREAAEKNI